MKIAKLILNFNTPELTHKLAMSVPGAIVIDNGSTIPITVTKVPYSGIRFADNLGFTRNWNRAIQYIMDQWPGKFDAFWLMNSDIVIDQDSIARIESLAESSNYHMLSASYNCWIEQCQNHHSPGVREVRCIELTAPVILSSVFESFDFFDERFILGYGVDLDFCYRMQKAGLKMYVDDLSEFHHIGHQTIYATDQVQLYKSKAMDELRSGMSEKYGPEWRNEILPALGINDIRF
jgi:GT2 family glycosyltransferase